MGVHLAVAISVLESADSPDGFLGAGRFEVLHVAPHFRHIHSPIAVPGERDWFSYERLAGNEFNAKARRKPKTLHRFLRGKRCPCRVGIDHAIARLSENSWEEDQCQKHAC